MSPDEDPLLARAGLSAAQLAAVLGLVADSDVAELEISLGATRLSLRRPPVSRVAAAAVSPAPPAVEPDTLTITSPSVGVFRPAVAPGEQIEPGQVVGAVEALGMPTSVDASRRGTVQAILVPDGHPVEYGQPLLSLHPTAPSD